jgi:undecaprenol kinase
MKRTRVTPGSPETEIQAPNAATGPSLIPFFYPQSFKARNVWQSLGFAMDGLLYAFKTQRNFRIHTLAALGVAALGIAVGLSVLEWVPIILVIGMVMCAELLNTAVETFVDWYSKGEYDARAKVIKDLTAGACLLSAVSAAGIGALIFIPHLWAFFSNAL